MSANFTRRASPSAFQRVALVLMLGYLVWTVYPLAWVAYSSLKTDAAIFQAPFALPDSVDALRWSNFSRTWIEQRFGGFFLNSVLVVSGAVCLILVLGSMAGYALSRFFHRWAGPLFWLFLAGMMLPIQLGMVPLFFQMRDWELLNSRLGLVLVYAANGLPFAMFILSGFYRTLPKALYEAALLDGCGEFTAFRRVMLPLAKPGLVTVAIFQFIILWKEYFYAFMLLSGGEAAGVSTLPLGLANLAVTSQYQTDYGLLFAGLAIVTLPLLVVYVALQKQLVKGVTAGAVKG